MTETVALLRSAAKAMRHDVEGHPFPDRQLPATLRATADWLDAEAAVRGEMEPFVDLLNAAISRKGGPEAYLRFGRDENGEPKMLCDTLNAAVAVAQAYLDGMPS